MCEPNLSVLDLRPEQIAGIERFAANQARAAAPGARSPSPEGKVSEEQWVKMGAAERLDYTRRFPQERGSHD